MKPLINKLIFYRTSQIKNISIVMGILVGVFLFSSFQDEKGTAVNDGSQQISSQIEAVTATEELETRSTKYHNFLTAYFIQESSLERSTKKAEHNGQFFSNLKGLHKVIISRASSYF